MLTIHLRVKPRREPDIQQPLVRPLLETIGGIPPLRGHLATHDAHPFGCASKPRVKPRREPDIHQPLFFCSGAASPRNNRGADGGIPQLSTQGCTRPSAASRENATSQQRACAQHAGFSVRSWHSLKGAQCIIGKLSPRHHRLPAPLNSNISSINNLNLVWTSSCCGFPRAFATKSY